MPFCNISTRALLITGLCGALLMFAGDMLLYYAPGIDEMTQEGIFAIMHEVNRPRLITGGAVGPLAGFLYCFGFLGLAGLVRDELPRGRAALCIIFCLGMVYGGAYHSHYPHLGLGAEVVTALSPTSCYVDFLNLWAFGFFALGGLLLIYLILRGRTYLRKYMALLSPLPMGLLIIPLLNLPAPLLIIIAGGWYNLMFVIFFSLCLAELKRRPGV